MELENVCGITEKESWTVLLLKNVQTERRKAPVFAGVHGTGRVPDR